MVKSLKRCVQKNHETNISEQSEYNPTFDNYLRFVKVVLGIGGTVFVSTKNHRLVSEAHVGL